jgi:hypothetical protein
MKNITNKKQTWFNDFCENRHLATVTYLETHASSQYDSFSEAIPVRFFDYS